jgi:uncharacterized protein (DUF302 family)
MIRKVEMERFTLISSKPFDQVLAAINDAIGHPDMAEFWRSTHRARSVAELESTIEKAVGKTGLMLFVDFDHGAIVCKETGRDTPRMIRFVIGNPLIMKEMVKHVPDAGSYAPITVLVDERADGVHRRFGNGSHLPLLFLQHFTGTLDNWDPAVTDRSRWGEKSFCSITQASVDPAVQCPKQWPEWRSTPWHSWMAWA